MAEPITIPNGVMILPVNLSSSFKTFTLPSVSINPGRMLIFKDMFGNAANSTIRLSTIGSDRIERSNVTSMALNTPYGAWTFMNDGISEWFLTNTYLNNLSIVNSTITPFSPRNIAGLQLWFDAADSSTVLVAASSAVQEWSDKSGNGRNFIQRTVALRPVYGTFLSAAGISFTAAQSLSNAYVQAGTGGRHTYLVFYDINTTATIYGNPVMLFMAVGASGAGRDWRTAFNGANNYLGIDIQGGAKSMTVTPNPTSMRTQRAIGLWGAPNSAIASTCYVYGNGTQFTTTVNSLALTTTTLNTANIAVTRVGGGPIFVLSEVLHYSSELTTAQRQSVEGYLAWKWGLQGTLPASHPYKNSPP